MAHEISIEELNEWQENEKVLFASSSKEEKKLYMTLSGTYEVYHKGELKLKTGMAFFAIDTYNQINK